MTSLILQDMQIHATVAKIHNYHGINLFPDKYGASALIYRERKSDHFHVFRHITNYKSALPVENPQLSKHKQYTG
jgi:hypothetical protein